MGRKQHERTWATMATEMLKSALNKKRTSPEIDLYFQPQQD